MKECEEVWSALDGLNRTGADFDSIENDLEQLKTKLTFFASSPEFPSTASSSALKECDLQITEHEKHINRHLSHFNKALNHEKSHPNLNFGAVSPEVLGSIDELVRMHLQQTGYATVAESMQIENSDQLGLDFTLLPFRYEFFVESMLYDITGGDSGHKFDSYSDIAEPQSPEYATDQWENERFLLNFFNSSHHNKVDDCQQVHEAVQELENRKPLYKFYLPKETIEQVQRWKKSKVTEYEFLKSMQHSTQAALFYLQSEAQKPGADIPQLTSLSGKLVTTDPKVLERKAADFVLDLRAELLAKIRNEDISNGPPRTDLNTMMNISAEALKKHLVPLQTVSRIRTRELPVEIDLPKDMWFHPIVVCPVKKEQVFPGDLRILPCGHMLSDDAIQAICEDELAIVKCPYCYQVSSLDEVVKGTLYTQYE